MFCSSTSGRALPCSVDPMFLRTGCMIFHTPLTRARNSAFRPIPPLFKPNHIRKQVIWDVISLVAPYRDEKKHWRTQEAVSAYCTKCNISIKWKIENAKPVHRHMKRFHSDILASNKKRRLNNMDQAVNRSGETVLSKFHSISATK